MKCREASISYDLMLLPLWESSSSFSSLQSNILVVSLLKYYLGISEKAMDRTWICYMTEVLCLAPLPAEINLIKLICPGNKSPLVFPE